MNDAFLGGNTDARGQEHRPPSAKCCQALAVGGSIMRIPSPCAVQANAQILDVVHYSKGSAAPAKVMVTSFRHRCRRPHMEDMTLVSVGTTAPDVTCTIVLHSVKDALKAQGAGRGRDVVISIGLQDKGEISNEETRVSTLGVHKGKQAINKNGILKRIPFCMRLSRDKWQPWATLQCTARGIYIDWQPSMHARAEQRW
jgi:hypothetical protein